MTADPVTPVLLALGVVLVAAKIGGHVAVRLSNPSVLGELLAGVVLGNLPLVGISGFAALAELPAVDILARLGVVLLLFEVGLESTVRDMLKVGWRSALVAVVGVVAPFGLGWAAGVLVLPTAGPLVHAFLGATLTATSVGITARVLKDLGRAQDPEARVILGAAVIDDVLGLVILSVVSGVVAGAATGQGLDSLAILWIVTKALGFLIGALVLGSLFAPPVVRVAARLEGGNVLLALSLAFAFLLAWASAKAGLAPIVGAYAAGLLLERAHFTVFEQAGKEHELEELVSPIVAMLAPVFFVLMGMHVQLPLFARLDVLGLALALTIAAVIGKLVCGLVVPAPLNRLAIGIGMVPRGEVGLIFASVGHELKVAGAPLISPPVYSAIVVMVILTTLITPPALAWALRRSAHA